MLTVGIDIGGTKIAGGVVDEAGTILTADRVPTPQDARGLERAVIDMVARLRAEHEVSAVGVAAAGFIDKDRSLVYHAPNIDWRNEPLRARLEEGIDVPVIIENDANAAGWAEYRFGAGRGQTDIVMLTIGTGIGGAIVANGELYRGGNGAGAELGHIRYQRDGLLCGCGQRGCIEQYAAGRALQRIANELADAGSPGLAAARQAEGELHGVTISRLVQEGDAGATTALRTIASALGEACGSFSATLDPQLYVIGGGVAQLGELLLEPMREAYRASVPAYGDRPIAEFTIATLVNDAGVIGAADLARGA